MSNTLHIYKLSFSKLIRLQPDNNIKYLSPMNEKLFSGSTTLDYIYFKLHFQLSNISNIKKNTGNNIPMSFIHTQI